MANCSKILVLGLDSVNMAALKPHLDAGRMPNLKALMDRGASGTLHSTLPPHTAPAWTTLATGKHPNVHGLLNFRRFDPRTRQSKLNTSAESSEKTIWQMLDEQGIKVGVVGQPMSYPLRPLKNGFAISGFDTPSTQSEFAWPAALKQEVLGRIPDFCFKSEHGRDPGKDWVSWEEFQAGFGALMAGHEQAHALNVHLAATKPWDVLFLYYQATDPLFHKAWRWCDALTREEDPRRAAEIDRFFKRLDEMLGEVLNLKQAQDAFVVVCSDHGHGPIEKTVRVNNLLHELGLLRRGGPLVQAGEFLKRIRKQPRFKGLGMGVDWSHTTAYMASEAISGFLYLNRAGREPGGRVDDGRIASALAEVCEKLGGQKCPHSGAPLFDRVVSATEAYASWKNAGHPEAFIQPAYGVMLSPKLSCRESVELPLNKQKGTHRPEGFFALCGAGVTAGVAGEAHIADLAPTILAALGRPVPADMTGQVLKQYFKSELAYQSGAATEQTADKEKPTYNDSETEMIERRLADLGYLE